MARLEDVIQIGTVASQPAATAVPIGTLYSQTDGTPANNVQRSNGTTWDNYAPGGSGSGTVTHTGTLAASALVVGNGGADVKAVAATDGQIPIGKSSDGSVTLATLTAGTNVTITNAAGAVTIAASGGGGGSEASIAIFTTIPAHPGYDPRFSGAAGEFTLTSNNRIATAAFSSPYNHIFGTPANYTGKRYFEIVPGSTSFQILGIAGGAGHAKRINGTNFGSFDGQLGWDPSGNVLGGCIGPGSPITVATIQGWSVGSICGFAVDLDALLIWFRTDAGNWNNNALNDPATGVGGIDASWALGGASNGLIWPGLNQSNTASTTMRLLAADFTETVPSGFAAWAT